MSIVLALVQQVCVNNFVFKADEGKQNVVSMQWILSSFKKEGNSGTCCSMDELRRHSINKQIIKTSYVYDGLHLHEVRKAG